MALSFIYSIWPYIKTGFYLILGDVRMTHMSPFYPLANEVAKGYSNATVRPSVTSL